MITRISLINALLPVTIKLSSLLSSIVSLRAAVKSLIRLESPYGRYLAQEEMAAVSSASGDRDVEAQDSTPCAICHDNLDTPVQLACRLSLPPKTALAAKLLMHKGEGGRRVRVC